MEVRALQSRFTELSLTGANAEKKSPSRGSQTLRDTSLKSESTDMIKLIGELENIFSEMLRKRDKEMKSLVDLERLNKILLSIDKNLKIELDDKLKIPIYKIIDVTTNEVLKQIPLEEILQFKRAFFEFLTNYLKKQSGLSGVLLNKEV